jgi:hypothetical protein
LKIQGAFANPPFETTISISTSGINGTAHIMVNDMALDLNADDTVTLTLSFDNTSFMAKIAKFPTPLAISALDGNFTVKAPIQLAKSGTKNRKALAVDLGTASVVINFSSTAKIRISKALAGTVVNEWLFTQTADKELTDFIRGLGTQTFPLEFNVIPGTNGSLSPSLQFEKLEVHCIENPDRNKQALGLFGILLVANHSKGKHTQKKATAITAGRDISISISPEAFQSTIFCPSLAKELIPKDFKKDPVAAVAKLPGACGSSAGVDKNGVTITNISCGFDKGHIDINGTAKKSGFCYEADASFHGEIGLKMDGATLKPDLKMDDPDVDVSIPWYCWLGAAGILWMIGGILLTVLGVIALGIATAIGNVVVDSIANSALGGIGVPGKSLGAIKGVSFKEVLITPEGLTVCGDMSITLPPATSKPSIKLEGSVVTSLSKVIKKGIYHNTFCAKGDYPFTQMTQLQVGTYKVVPTLLGLPLTLECEISAGTIDIWGFKASESVKVALPGKSGTVIIPKVSTHYPLPLPDGTVVTQKVHIGYSISGNTIKLTNVPKEGNFYFWLRVKAKDPLGNTRETEKQGRFEGDAVTIGGGYHKKMSDCLDLLNEKLQITTLQTKVDIAEARIAEPWVHVDYPPPERLIAYVQSVMSYGTPDSDEILAHTRLLHGKSLYRALGSSESISIWLKQKRLDTEL